MSQNQASEPSVTMRQHQVQPCQNLVTRASSTAEASSAGLRHRRVRTEVWRQRSMSTIHADDPAAHHTGWRLPRSSLACGTGP
eukprot:995602-Rhodomonas_salina.1